MSLNKILKELRKSKQKLNQHFKLLSYASPHQTKYLHMEN